MYRRITLRSELGAENKKTIAQRCNVTSLCGDDACAPRRPLALAESLLRAYRHQPPVAIQPADALPVLVLGCTVPFPDVDTVSSIDGLTVRRDSRIEFPGPQLVSLDVLCIARDVYVRADADRPHLST